MIQHDSVPDNVFTPRSTNSSHLRESPNHSSKEEEAISAAADVLQIDSLQLLRIVYKRSITKHRGAEREEAAAHITSKLDDDNNEVTTIRRLSLLDYIAIVRNESNPTDFTVQFRCYNISIHSDAPSQWIEQGTRLTFGCLVLLALKAQAGSTEYHSIEGDVSKKAENQSIHNNNPSLLLSVLEDDHYDPNCYDWTVLTPISRIDQTKPIVMDSSVMLCLLFKQSQSDIADQNIWIGECPINVEDDLERRLEARYKLPCRKYPKAVLNSKIVPTALQTFSTASMNSNMNGHPCLQSSSFLPSIQSNLLTLTEMTKVDRNFAPQIIRLFNQHLKLPKANQSKRQRTTHNHQKQEHVSSSSPKPAQYFENQEHSRMKAISRFDQLQRKNESVDGVCSYSPMGNLVKQPRTIEEGKTRIPPWDTTTRSVPSKNPDKRSAKPKACSFFEVLANRKWNPILIVPSASSSLKSSSLIHLDNIREFLGDKCLSTLSDNHEAQNSRLDFIWNAMLPLSEDASGVPIGIKVVGDAQITRFKPNDWFRVVAVIVHGADWQFENWPFANARHLFNCIRGVYFAYENDAHLPAIVSYNPIDVLRLKRNSRHSDITAWNQFVSNISNVLQKPRNFSLFDKTKFQISTK